MFAAYHHSSQAAPNAARACTMRMPASMPMKRMSMAAAASAFAVTFTKIGVMTPVFLFVPAPVLPSLLLTLLGLIISLTVLTGLVSLTGRVRLVELITGLEPSAQRGV